VKHRRLIWHIYPYFAGITLFSLIAVTWYTVGSLRDFYMERLEDSLEARARLVQDHLAELLRKGRNDEIDEYCKRMGRETATRITVSLPSGEVIGDSDEMPSRMKSHADRPEIVTALKSGRGVSQRRSPTLGRNMMYLAIPMAREGHVLCVVRTSVATSAIEDALRLAYWRILIGAAVVTAVALIAGVVVSRRISRPLQEMRYGAMQYAVGNLEHRLYVAGAEELCGLAESLNIMAGQLDDRIRTIVRQRNEQDAVLSSMVEAVVAVDSDGRVIGMNKAASKITGAEAEQAHGRTIQEVIRNADLQTFVARALSDQEPFEGEIVLRDKGDMILQVHGTVLRDAEGTKIGALVVLNDVTRLRRLESVRRDFVANVSHELKTPITCIKGFVETLQEGAAKDPESAERFLKIIAKQANRLQAIIEDLLCLSWVEAGADRARIEFEETSIADMLGEAADLCRPKAEEKKISLEIECSSDVTARMNTPLIEQAVVNLVDNATKYSSSGGKVRILAEKDDSGVIICVIDQGCGIEKEHLPRLFERFYRVDKARSRDMGGTGLGLAIVKHIADAHGGSVSVESRPGKGSKFSIHLPRR